MNSFDLDINNYSIKDIEKFFKLKPKSKYTASQIELKEYQIREQLLTSGHIDKRMKTDLIDFLNKAKEWLIFVKCKEETENKMTTIPKNYKLDEIDIPISKDSISRENELIKRPNTQFIYSNNSNHFPGILNPLDTRVITKCLNIDTRFRDNYYSTQCSDFTIKMPTKLNKVVSMQLAALEFPVSFYGISSSIGNNFLYFTVKYTSLTDASDNTLYSENYNYVIPDGNYNANDLVDLLNTTLSPRNTDGSIINTYAVVSYIQFVLDITTNGSGSGKITLNTTGIYSTNIKEIILDFTKSKDGIVENGNIVSKIGWNLGFTKPLYSGSTSYTADTIIEPATIRYIYLAVDDFNNNSNNHFISVYNNSLVSPDVLARISIKGSYFSLIMENDFNIISEPRHYFGPVDIQKLRIRLFDEYGRILNMNNSNFSFCLNLKLLYDL